MTLDQRTQITASVSPSVTTDEGLWKIGQPPGLNYPYGEILLLDNERTKILQAFPMKYAPPTYLVVTNAAVFAAHAGDGALPDSTVVGIDRKTRRFFGVTYHCTSCADQEPPAARSSLFKFTERELQIYDLKADPRAVWAKDAKGTWTKLNPLTLDIAATGVKSPSG